ncbi:MAG: hypothetical protein ACREFH_03970 [Stellaceae bacterium]
MQTAEVRVAGSDLFQLLTEMGVWLDGRRCEPSSFTYFYLGPGLKIRIVFETGDDARAFAQKFGGSLLADARPKPTRALGTMTVP